MASTPVVGSVKSDQPGTLFQNDFSLRPGEATQHINFPTLHLFTSSPQRFSLAPSHPYQKQVWSIAPMLAALYNVFYFSILSTRHLAAFILGTSNVRVLQSLSFLSSCNDE
ncbi:hypothetical protein EJ05DRAFT_279398 [Pseudovirgaria hyperparasitica]|uniref:Uncharacterized protein n=1 Tax=Pseudovirgaria hyperparasitica TaxID=470096 RepID=A0A6A6WE89_9PEZI|nr:uncharacterized protein EJ05DRAFT_279398 [Pseudovirgaria hyperparasitica]KAF2760310.1 hypothetical protein EJ05DRAFT_279398 [Pseudovirgaria hyperparasitica]